MEVAGEAGDNGRSRLHMLQTRSRTCALARINNLRLPLTHHLSPMLPLALPFPLPPTLPPHIHTIQYSHRQARSQGMRLRYGCSSPTNTA